ncbi:NUDIX domain-containing protein, partial [Bacteroidales bacterium OttesenSCG-928-A14]|nr:NUDIX domain-containing protein [Bacteroidales bacterium OttesenSCG-928-A14]
MNYPITIYIDDIPIEIDNAQNLKTRFGLYRKIEAAGGIVVNGNGDILMIYRRGFWDFPKGKIEKNETPKEAAIREVAEETGVMSLRISEELNPTYHTYTQDAEAILKKTHWFVMENDRFENTKPQIEEDITEIRWVKCDEVAGLLSNS